MNADEIKRQELERDRLLEINGKTVHVIMPPPAPLMPVEMREIIERFQRDIVDLQRQKAAQYQELHEKLGRAEDAYDDLEKKLRLKDLQNRGYRTALEKIHKILTSTVASEQSMCPKMCEIARDALTEKRKCPSTYTHSNRGKLECEKDESHLHRVGDVEHKNGRTIWMSV